MDIDFLNEEAGVIVVLPVHLVVNIVVSLQWLSRWLNILEDLP